jgi:hypothetical protein
MKKLFASVALLVAASWALAGGVPNLPNTAPFNDPSQVLSTLQTLINQLNGNPAYAPVANIGLGSICTLGGLTPGTPQTCNAQRASITSATLTTAALTSQSLLVNNSLVTANSNCIGSINNYSGAFSTNGIPILYALVPTAGQLQVFIGNASATNALNGTLALTFYCVN